MKGSDSQRPLTPRAFGFPLSLSTRIDLCTVVVGPLLFRVFPWILDVSLCSRKTLPPKAFERSVLPADPGGAIGVFNDINFGIYHHTSYSFLSTLRTRHY